MSRAASTLGFLAVAGGGVLALIAWQQQGGWSGPLQGVRTSAGGDTRAQVLQNLEAREAELTRKIRTEEAEIASEYERRINRATFEGQEARIASECEPTAWYDVAGWVDPYRGCDDQVVREAEAAAEAWRRDATARRVDPLRQELATVRAEIDSVMLTA